MAGIKVIGAQEKHNYNLSLKENLFAYTEGSILLTQSLKMS